MTVKNRGEKVQAQRSETIATCNRIILKSYGKVISFLVISSYTLALSASCSLNSVLKEPIPNEPASRIIDLKPSLVIKGVERALKNKKFTLKPGQPDSNQFQTEWLQDGSYRSMMFAEVNPAGKGRSELTVHLILQKKKFRGTWQPVDEIGKHVYDNFMDAVQIESYRALYDQR